MSRMSDLLLDIQEAICDDALSFSQIAAKFNVPLSWVTEAASMMDDIDDSMNGDHASALASAGFGTDEDYFYVMENDYDDSY